LHESNHRTYNFIIDWQLLLTGDVAFVPGHKINDTPKYIKLNINFLIYLCIIVVILFLLLKKNNNK